jgi:hypothetical protein
MSRSTDLSRLFRSAVVLIVEDELTRQYLQRLKFQEPIVIHVAGGAGGVRALVDAARADGLVHVYGVVDRDYGQENFSRWRTSEDIRCFILPVHEVENLLLDEIALENAPSNNSGRNAFQIREHLFLHAKSLTWTSALREVLTFLRHSLLHDFPTHKSFSTFDESLHYITRSSWFEALIKSTDRMKSEPEISSMLKNAQAKAASTLLSDAWRHSFPGKELFHVARSYIYQAPRPQPGVSAPTRSQLDVTLAQEIAEWQVDNLKIPNCIVALRDVIRARHGV